LSQLGSSVLAFGGDALLGKVAAGANIRNFHRLLSRIQPLSRVNLVSMGPLRVVSMTSSLRLALGSVVNAVVSSGHDLSRAD
jgi:hypothetical protein